jgi:hypothetical protein
MRLNVIRDLSGSTIFFHIISQTARFREREKKDKVIEHKMCFVFLSTFLCFADRASQYNPSN